MVLNIPDTKPKWTQLENVKMLLKIKSFIKTYILLLQKYMSELELGCGISASMSKSISTLAPCAGTFVGGSSSQARVHISWDPWLGWGAGWGREGKAPRKTQCISGGPLHKEFWRAGVCADVL